MTKQKRYVIRKGKETGIFTSRNECKSRVHGYTGAQYKSYESLSAAKHAFSQTYNTQITHSPRTQTKNIKNYLYAIEKHSICVDAACSSNPGILERQCVETISGKKLFASTQYPLGTTNIGEWIALVQGMRFLVENNRKEHIIYSDSRVALGWVQKGTIKTTLDRNSHTSALWNIIDSELTRLIEVGTKFLKNHKIILQKWKTKERGEIPADYGRK